ncbi:hypothetical protein DESAMIL20_321 [Desulfurella amilsii]|uniref:Uncharacterized protein n=1 Tax=Desulfurella amilsii TaxID=1562698 RepID=A0A1X4XY72_9BACT|nr:hypothetical protein DESAMIL20_706 [Desulfurella amilsii]OSS42891.1 hypothetical protein DESAMIL20_321 [Desulfurella amilsii]
MVFYYTIYKACFWKFKKASFIKKIIFLEVYSGKKKFYGTDNRENTRGIGKRYSIKNGFTAS